MEEFKTCPILEAFVTHGTISNVSNEHFLKPLSEYNRKRLESVLKGFAKSIGIDSTSMLIWKEIVSYALSDIAPSIKKSSWKRYRVSLNAVFNAALDKELAPVTYLRNLLGSISVVNVDHRESDADVKANRIHVNEVYILRIVADTEDERLALDWLEFNIMTGLRPNEVEQSSLIYPLNGAPILRAKNTIKSNATKKNIENGSMALFREIDLSHLSFHDILTVERFLTSIHQRIDNDGYESLYETIRHKLKSMTKKYLGHSISLSVGRTQFAANYKALNPEKKEELANLMGHTDLTRPTRSYGGKRYGFAKMAIVDQEEVRTFDE